MTLTYVEVETGVRVYVQDVGAGRPVVLLAGVGLSHEVWDREVRELISAGHRAVCIDLRGTGLSDKPAAGYDVARLAADVNAVLRAIDLRSATLVGWSFGGQVGFKLAATAPERLAQLVLVCSSGVSATRRETFPFGLSAEPIIEALRRGEFEDRIRSRAATLASGFHARPDPDLLAFLLRVQLQMPSWAAVPSYEAYLLTDLVDACPSVTLPVLQILGRRDPVLPPGAADWLEGQLADCRSVVIDSCGHYPMFEAGSDFDRELIAGLA